MSGVIGYFLDGLKRSDKVLWTLILIISVYCLLLIKSVSREGINFFPIQLLAVTAGIIGALVLQSFDYRGLASRWKAISFFCILLIVYTLFFGIAVEGSAGVNAKAWIKLPGGITFQPSELVKIGFILTFSKHLSTIRQSGKISSFINIMLVAVHALIPVILTHLQGDDGAAIIFLFMAMSMAFMSGIPLRYFVFVIIVGILLLPVAWEYILADYQKQRIINQMDPESDPLNMGYQQIQGKLSIASGGLSGYGLFKGPRVAKGSVPVQESDFIFSVAGEELGFIGCMAILLLILLLLFKTVMIARKSSDDIGAIICFGFFGLIASQTIFNLGMCLSLLPVMGVTLPFFSSGGSSTACLYLGIGLLQSVHINREDGNKSVYSSGIKSVGI